MEPVIQLRGVSSRRRNPQTQSQNEAVVQLRGVAKIYSNDWGAPALDDVSLDIRRGEVTLLMGPSGSGKTTLISIIGGILRPSCGSVTIAGTEIAELDEGRRPAVRRRHIGFIFQSFNLMPCLNAAENVEAALKLKGITGSQAGHVARELLSVVGLSHKCDALPADLSGGEKQRVAIARALAGNPDIILADEPTAALDSASGRIVMEKLRDLAHSQGRAVLVVTHDNRVLEYADRVIQIGDGRILSDSAAPGALAAAEVPVTQHPIVPKTPKRPAPRKFKLRWLVVLPILIAAWLAADLLGFHGFKLRGGNPAQPLARRAPLVISGAGRVEPASEEVRIGAPAPGRLLAVTVQEGQYVKQGQVIATLDNSDLSARIAQAEANVQLHQADLDRLEGGASVSERNSAAAGVAEAQAILDNARAETAQRQALFDYGDVSRAELERSEREVRLAQTRLDKALANAATVNSPARQEERARATASLHEAMAQLAEAKALLGKTVIRAPFDGVVLRRYHRAGEEVGPGGDPIVSFGDVSRLIVRVDVDEADIARIHEGDSAYCTAQAYGNTRFTGKVIQIARQLGRKNIETGDPAEKVDTRVLETLIGLDGSPQLPVGLRVNAFIGVASDSPLPGTK